MHIHKQKEFEHECGDSPEAEHLQPGPAMIPDVKLEDGESHNVFLSPDESKPREAILYYDVSTKLSIEMLSLSKDLREDHASDLFREQGQCCKGWRTEEGLRLDVQHPLRTGLGWQSRRGRSQKEARRGCGRSAAHTGCKDRAGELEAAAVATSDARRRDQAIVFTRSH